MLTVFILILVHWFTSLFFQTFFLHRYCSHEMYKINSFWERVFYFLTWLTQGPSFLHPSSYAIMHMEHHKHSDTELDPHSPLIEPNLYRLMLNTYKKYMGLVDQSNIPHYQTKLHFDDWKRLDRFSQTHWNTILWIVIYISAYLLFEVPWFLFPFLIVHFLMGPIQGAIVNYAGHKFGYSNFDIGDNSKNTLPVDILLMGELYQNNHHKNGKRMNFAYRYFEIDITYQIAKLLHLIGIIKIKGKLT